METLIMGFDKLGNVLRVVLEDNTSAISGRDYQTVVTYENGDFVCSSTPDLLEEDVNYISQKLVKLC